MNKYKKMNQILSDYFNNVTRKQLIEDSRKAGIILICMKCNSTECKCEDEKETTNE